MTGAVMYAQDCGDPFILFVGYLHFPFISQLPKMCVNIFAHYISLSLSLSLSLSHTHTRSLSQTNSNLCSFFSFEGMVNDEKQPKMIFFLFNILLTCLSMTTEKLVNMY